MGHMDETYTVGVWMERGDANPESFTFKLVTEFDADGDHLEFNDCNGKKHIFHGVTYHIAED